VIHMVIADHAVMRKRAIRSARGDHGHLKLKIHQRFEHTFLAA